MIRRLAKCIREYKKEAIASPILVSIEVVLEILTTYLVSKLIDYGIEAGNMSEIMRYGIILVLLAILSLVFGALSGIMCAKASAGFAKNLRHDLYHKIQEYSFANIDKFSTSSIVTRLTTDVTNVQNSFQMIIRVAFRAPLMFLFSIVMTYRISSSLGNLILCLIPPLAIGFLVIIKIAHPTFEKVFKTYDELNNVVQENVKGIRVVKSFVNEDFENKKFKNVSDKIYKLFKRAEDLVAINRPLMQIAMYAGMILISWISAKSIVAGSMTTGQLTIVISYAMQILGSLMMFSMIFVTIMISRASMERVVELLNEEVNLKSPENAIFDIKNGDIEFKDVSFSYVNDEEKLALRDVNLKIKSGEIVGVLGGTGSSKTTLVQMIPRLYDATKGKVLVGGVDVKDYDLTSLRDNVAMVLQKNELFSGTIKDNIRWGNENAPDEEVVRVCKLAQADSFIEGFPDKYDTYIEQGGTNVSGGQKQRLCIARALLKKPKILILDDSTSAVDTKTDALIRKAFREEIPDTTKIIIAQRISSIQDADKIIILNEGKIEAVGTHEELIKNNEIYKDVYTSQMKGGEDNA
ncbi:MAG: ABC transporter ATP-binding protein [Clostridia bacterium]|nr:ABC transporter ATP-binding protein [Clostridia bacterium]